MLKTYEVRLTQSDIEFIDGCLDRYAPASPILAAEIQELRLRLNGVLTCEAGECDEPRKGMDTLCAWCADVRDEAYRTYRGAVQAGMIEGV